METNVETARRGYEAALRGDPDVIRELLDPDVKWHGGGESPPRACHSRRDALRFVRSEPAALVANLTTFRDGKVVEMVHYANPDDALTAARTKRGRPSPRDRLPRSDR